MQLGFDLEYTDPNTHELVPWAMPTDELFERIEAAAWKVVDVETTGLNPASKELNFSGKEIRRGVDPTLRLRVLSIAYPLMGTAKGYHVVGFDFDQLSTPEREKACTAAMTNVVIAHNAGFDAYWVGRGTSRRPTLLLDSMLIARVLYPEQPLVMARMCNDEGEDPELRDIAIAMFTAGRSGWALADLAAGKLRRVLSKAKQGPKNWAQPFLDQESYNYATGDTIVLLDLIMALFGIDDVSQLLDRYYELREQNAVLRIIEPQVLDVVAMREFGMPWNREHAEQYVAQQWEKVKQKAQEMVELEPTLAPHIRDLADAKKGVTAVLKTAIGNAFTARGLELDMTEKSGAFKIGEKDLRRSKAQVTPEAEKLFNTWVGLNRAKKAGGMALEVMGFAQRSGDWRLHPNTGHGPVTGRLSSAEPNCQQFPRDQGFRDCVTAPEGYKIVASDYSALDMRVGAALAIRAQRQILEAYMGDRVVAPDVLRIITAVLEGRVTLEQARAAELRATKAFADWKARREEVADDGNARKRYWEEYRRRARTQLLAGFQRCYREVRMRADAANTAEWGSLRDAFSIAGMDIHSWTALGMIGKDPQALFGGLSDADVAAALKVQKKELGDDRQTGKVGNLSLLYAMKELGLQDAAAKNYNIHWTLEKAAQVRGDWLAAYVEVDLWHKWTELNPVEQVYVPDSDRGGKFAKKDVFASYTLGDRLIYAFGLNAALSYEDQSTGADILGRVMEQMRLRHPDIYRSVCNQVHDEIVFQIRDENVEGHTRLIQDLMVECAEHYLSPFGVRGECSPAVGQTWLKD